VEICERNGLFGVWGRPPDESERSPALEFDAYATTRSNKRKATEEIPHVAVGEEALEEPVRETSSLERDVSLSDPRQILPYYFGMCNEQRGAFTHHAFACEGDSLTASTVPLPIDSFSVAGLAVIFTPKLQHLEINDVMTSLLQKLDKELGGGLHARCIHQKQTRLCCSGLALSFLYV
jgi:hypothetical protein